MTKFFKTIISAALCITLILPTTLKADASNKDTSVIIKDSYSYTDDQNNLIKIDQEIDGTIDVYINSILDHSAKSDLKNDTITVVKYNKQSAKALSKESPNTSVYKLSDLYDIVPDSVESNVSNNVSSTSELHSLATDPQFPYSSGYSYSSSYFDSGVTNLTVDGFKKPDGIEYTTENVVSFTRGMLIGTAVSMIITVISGGTVTAAAIIEGIIATVVGGVIDGIFTRNASLKVNLQITWAKWLGWIKAKDYQYYARQGTVYLRTVNPTANLVDLTLLSNEPPRGFMLSFNDFLRVTIAQYTNR